MDKGDYKDYFEGRVLRSLAPICTQLYIYTISGWTVSSRNNNSLPLASSSIQLSATGSGYHVNITYMWYEFRTPLLRDQFMQPKRSDMSVTSTLQSETGDVIMNIHVARTPSFRTGFPHTCCQGQTGGLVANITFRLWYGSDSNFKIQTLTRDVDPTEAWFVWILTFKSILRYLLLPHVIGRTLG